MIASYIPDKTLQSPALVRWQMKRDNTTVLMLRWSAGIKSSAWIRAVEQLRSDVNIKVMSALACLISKSTVSPARVNVPSLHSVLLSKHKRPCTKPSSLLERRPVSISHHTRSGGHSLTHSYSENLFQNGGPLNTLRGEICCVNVCAGIHKNYEHAD